MKDGDLPNPREQAPGTVPSQGGQAIDSENSSGSVYHSTATNLEGDGGLTTLHNSSAVSESDSTEHFSDAIQESDDTASVYSAEEAPQRDEGTIQVLVSKSSLHQWSASHSKISILQNDSSGSQPTPSRIPLPTHDVDLRLPGTQSSKSFQFDRTVVNNDGSRIPIPLRIRDTFQSQSLKGSKSEPKIPSRPSSAPEREQNRQSDASPTRNLVDAHQPEDFASEEVPSSESENITAIQPYSEGGLEKFRSEDLLGDSIIIPFDSPDPQAHIQLQGSSEVSQYLPTAPPLSLSDENEKDDSAAISNPPLPERCPSYTIVSFSSQAFDVSDGEEPITAEHQDPVFSHLSQISSDPVIPVKSERIEIVELDRAHPVETLPASPVKYLQVNVSDLIAMGQANAREALVPTAETVDSGAQQTDSQEIIYEGSGSLKMLPSEYEPNDDEYVDESPEPSSLKKVTRFGKLKNKLQGRTSSKEMSLKKTGSSAKATLKIRRKPPKAPSRPSSAKRPITPPRKSDAVVLKPKGTTSGMSRFSSIRASIKQDVEKMKLGGKLDLGGLKQRSTSDIVILANEAPETSKSDLKEDKASDHSIRDIIQDQPPQQSSTPKSQKMSREEDTSATVVLTPSSQTKLNTLTSRYRVQMRKYKSQVADLTELQNKSGALHESLSQLKTQIISMAGGLPSSLTDLPAPIVMAAAVASADFKEEPTLVNSQIEEMTAENENLRSEIGRLHSNLNVVCRENKMLKEELVSVKEQLSTTRKTVIELTKANEERLQNTENAKLETQKARRVADTYRRKLEEFQKSSNEQKVKNEEDKSRRLENEKMLVAEVNALKNKLQLEVTKRECSQRSLANLSEEKENLESQIRNFQTTIAEHQQQQREQKQEMEKVRRVHEENNLLQNNVSKLEAEIMDLQKHIEELESRLETSENNAEETTKNCIKMTEDLFVGMNQIKQLKEKHRLEQEKRMDLYKIISNLSSLVGFEVDYQDLETASNKENCENTQLILKICSDFDRVLRNKDAEIEKQKQQNADLQSLHQEKQSLIEQLYEFVNEKNASICRREGVTKEHPDFTELYSMLEVKRHTLLRMESQIRSLQEVHAHCGMRRTMQESRIAELETMLANCLD
uniref:Plectin n=2 Tax=Lygus hesperus TaxID=30085 RepID=A0A0A9YY68_LYGHE